MAFDAAMKSMGGKMKPKSAKSADEHKGKDKPEPKGKTGGEGGDGPGDAKSEMNPIHEHLQAMHEMTGNAHTHVEHHMDGHHTSHHISSEGAMSGPHEHGSTEEVKQGMDQNLGMGMADSGNAQVGNEPQHAMSGF